MMDKIFDYIFEHIDEEIKRAIQQLTERFTNQMLEYILDNELQEAKPEDIAKKYLNIKPIKRRRCRTKIIYHEQTNQTTLDDVLPYINNALKIINSEIQQEYEN